MYVLIQLIVLLCTINCISTYNRWNKEFSHLYIGILNPYDLIASKLFRGTEVDFEDCLMLMKSRKESIDLTRVEQHIKELASYDISEKRIVGNLENFLNLVRKETRYG